MGNSIFQRALPRFALACAIVVLAAPAFGANTLTGKWSGTVDVHDASSGSTISTPIEVQLDEPQPGVVAGKIGREGDADLVPIRNGKLQGDHVTFEAASGETTGSMAFDLLLTGDRLEGRISGAIETQQIQGNVKLARVRN